MFKFPSPDLATSLTVTLMLPLLHFNPSHTSIGFLLFAVILTYCSSPCSLTPHQAFVNSFTLTFTQTSCQLPLNEFTIATYIVGPNNYCKVCTQLQRQAELKSSALWITRMIVLVVVNVFASVFDVKRATQAEIVVIFNWRFSWLGVIVCSQLLPLGPLEHKILYIELNPCPGYICCQRVSLREFCLCRAFYVFVGFYYVRKVSADFFFLTVPIRSSYYCWESLWPTGLCNIHKKTSVFSLKTIKVFLLLSVKRKLAFRLLAVNHLLNCFWLLCHSYWFLCSCIKANGTERCLSPRPWESVGFASCKTWKHIQ